MTDYASKAEATDYADTLTQVALEAWISEVKIGLHRVFNTVGETTTQWHITSYSLATGRAAWSRNAAIFAQSNSPVQNASNDDDVQWWAEENPNRTVMAMFGDYAVTLNLKTNGDRTINPAAIDSNGHQHWTLADNHLVMRFIQDIADLQYYDQNTVLMYGERLYKGVADGDQRVAPTASTDANWQIVASVDRTKHIGKQTLSSISDAGSMASQNIWSGTQAQLDAIVTRDANTFYMVPEVAA